MLNSQIKDAISSIEARRKFIQSLTPHFGRPIEADPHFNSHGVPVKSPNITECPWSPRWSPSEKADRMLEFLAEEALNFKKYCNQLNQQ
ncbi:hypothetical protein C2S51_015014 [Perilla frutescens var. frutescens]|nr:hypothetical protein C2S51_015014 [Perilla frutescens var. frutescens]